MTCEQCQDLLPLYALDALEGAERAGVRAHLQAGCPACEGHLAQMQATLALMPLAAAPMAPPLGAKARLMTRIRAGGDGPTAVERTNVQRITPPSAGSSVPPRRLGWIGPAILSGAAAAVLTGVIFSNLLSAERKSLDALRDQIARKDDQIQQLQTSQRDATDSVRVQLAAKDDQLRQLTTTLQVAKATIRQIESPAVQVVALGGTEKSPSAKGRLFWDATRNTARFAAAGLRPLPAGKAYELWLINDKGDKIPAGTFASDAGGEGSVSFTATTAPGTLVAAAVTDEPAAGVAAPTGAIQLLGKVQ